MSVTRLQPVQAKLRAERKMLAFLPVLRRDVAANGPAWPPLVLVLGAFIAVAYADHLVVSISLVYLYLLPLAVGAIFLRKPISYSLIAVCILFHDYYSPRALNPGLRIFHNLSAALCFAFIVYIIQRYIDHLAKRGRPDRRILLADTAKIRLDLIAADFQRVNYVVLMSTRFIPEF